MVQANSHDTTHHIMCPPPRVSSRRGFLAQAAVVTVAGGAVGFAMGAPADAKFSEQELAKPDPTKISDELRALVDVLHDASDALKAAGVPYDAMHLKLQAWNDRNPEPPWKARRVYRKWQKRYDRKLVEIDHDHLFHMAAEARAVMSKAQYAVAAYRSKDFNELCHKACLVVAYEDTSIYPGRVMWSQPIIATGVAIDAVNLCAVAGAV